MTMIDINRNIQINAALSALYVKYSAPCLEAYRDAFSDPTPPCRINEFGIVDVSRYDADNGVLFLAKETNDWSNQEFEDGYYFREWMHRMSQEGVGWHEHIKRHPTMWYNMGRWAMCLNDPNRDLSYIRSCANEAVLHLGTVAYTNVNKVRGYSSSGKEYWEMAMAPVSGELLRAELEVLKPKTVVCCGTHWLFCHHAPEFKGTVINMPHPGAYKSVLSMLESLREQYEKQVSP